MIRFGCTLVAWILPLIALSANETNDSVPQPSRAASPWLSDMDEGLAQARSRKKPMLVFFSASDWCQTCRKLNDDVFSQSGFLDWARNRIVLVEIDAPIDRSSLSQAKKSRQQEWLKKFRVAGFPTVFLTDDTGRPFAITGYQKGGVSAYLRHLSQLLQIRLIRDASFSLASESTGATKARHLDTALSNVDERLLIHHYAPEIASIQEIGDEQQREKYASIAKRNGIDSPIVGSSIENENEDPLKSIRNDMQLSADFLREAKFEPLVLDIQPRIERRLGRMIELLDDSASSNGGGKSSQNAKNPASDSTRRKRQAAAGPLRDPTRGGKDWAELSPKQREKIIQSKSEGFPGEFHDILSDYFRRLAKEDGSDAEE